MPAPAVVGGSAISFLQALNKKKTVSSSKNLKGAIDGLNQASESGAIDAIKSSLEGLGKSFPALKLLEVIYAKIQAGTSQKTLELLNKLLELLASPVGVMFLELAISFINTLLDGSTTLTSIFTIFSNFLGRLFGSKDEFTLVSNSVDKVTTAMDYVNIALEKLDYWLNKIADDAETITNKFKLLDTEMGKFKVDPIINPEQDQNLIQTLGGLLQ